MICQKFSEHSSKHPRVAFLKKVFSIYAANLWKNTHAKVRFQQSSYASLLKPHFRMLISFKSAVCLQNTLFEEGI